METDHRQRRHAAYPEPSRETALLNRFYQLPRIKSAGKMILDPVWTREMHRSGTKNVSEVVYAVGYNDSNYFSKVFHRYFGVSPQAARRPPSAPQDGRGRKSKRD